MAGGRREPPVFLAVAVEVLEFDRGVFEVEAQARGLRGDSRELTTVARAPLSNRTAATETSSVSVGRVWRSASAVICDQGPRTDSIRSN